jgi:two-component system LytT family response regulator
MKIIIIDDEKLARDLIKNYLADIPEVDILTECLDGFEALKAINELKPDVIFLDVQMPKLNGFELIEVLDFKPIIIFTTAFDEYAIKAFELNAADYLLKPFSKNRFIEAINKAKYRLNNKNIENTRVENIIKQVKENIQNLNRIVVKTGSKIKIISVSEIIYFESADDYVFIHTHEGQFLKEVTMKYLELHLPPDIYVRIHRSYIVNLNFITQMELYEKDSYRVVLKNGTKLDASKSGVKRLKEIMKF